MGLLSQTSQLIDDELIFLHPGFLNLKRDQKLLGLLKKYFVSVNIRLTRFKIKCYKTKDDFEQFACLIRLLVHTELALQ